MQQTNASFARNPKQTRAMCWHVQLNAAAAAGSSASRFCSLTGGACHRLLIDFVANCEVLAGTNHPPPAGGTLLTSTPTNLRIRRGPRERARREQPVAWAPMFLP